MQCCVFTFFPTKKEKYLISNFSVKYLSKKYVLIIILNNFVNNNVSYI